MYGVCDSEGFDSENSEGEEIEKEASGDHDDNSKEEEVLVICLMICSGSLLDKYRFFCMDFFGIYR